MLRKALLYVAFLALGLLFLVGRPAYQHAFDRLYNVPAATPKLSTTTYYLAAAGDSTAIQTVAAAENASGTKIEAEKAGGGWVPSGTVASKFITAAGALILMVVLIWRLQNLTHPEPSRWAKDEYTADFKSLRAVEKFEVYGRVRLQYVLLAAAALVFAALVV